MRIAIAQVNCVLGDMPGNALKILDDAAYDDDPVPRDNHLVIMDETLDSLTRRVVCLETGMAWAEDPPSRTRRDRPSTLLERSCRSYRPPQPAACR